ncbi:coiled-coil domain-containing protein 34 [Drosophila busckii]|uniref:coiled-coil domain-containing protein 34 n=1 Tax=Drosophila busckii TaxID=30019 RepID=UPI00083EC6D6|nr:coiled-coil domain-containing protein 34 [Drosophila busckii]
MAFLGRWNKGGKFVDCEVYNGSCSKLKTNPSAADRQAAGAGADAESLCTYIRTYTRRRSGESSVHSPGTVRYVGDSGSIQEVHSLADTEMSTLRCGSRRSTETESLTLCMSPPQEPSSDNSSTSEVNGYASADEEEVVREKGSTTSMCSWEEQEYEEPQQPYDTQSYEVPELELGSVNNSLHAEPQSVQLKLLRQSNEAYDNWLSAKKRQCQYKQQAARSKRQQQQQQEALRQQLNEQRVREWCERKSQQYANAVSKQHQTDAKINASQLSEQSLRQLRDWELKKIDQIERQRQREQREARRKQQAQMQRKQQAELAWQHWIKGVAQRPKPVPLNQGMATLRGTVSQIYVNPAQWVHVSENNSRIK